EVIRVQPTTHDPSKVILVTDEKSSGACVGRSAPPLPGHGKRPVPRPADARPCRAVGARLRLPAGALVDAEQQAAQGPVSLQFATLNPARRSLPGDYRAVAASKD